MELQWEVTSTNRKSSPQNWSGQSGKQNRRRRLDCVRSHPHSASNKIKSAGSSEFSSRDVKKASCGSGNPSPIKFARSVVESTRSKVIARWKNKTAKGSPAVPESPVKFVPSVCERTRSRSRSLTPGPDSKLQTSSSLFRRQCDSRASTPNSDINSLDSKSTNSDIHSVDCKSTNSDINSLDCKSTNSDIHSLDSKSTNSDIYSVDCKSTNSDINSVESKNTDSRSCSPLVNQDSVPRRNPKKQSVVRTPLKVRVKPILSGSDDNLQARKVSVFPKEKIVTHEEEEKSAEVSIFKNVEEALNSLSTEKKTLVPLVCLQDYQLNSPSKHKSTPCNVEGLKKPFVWNTDILDRIRKVGRLLKAKENIEEEHRFEGTLNKSDVDSMDLSVIDEVAAYGARCDVNDSDIKETVTNGIDRIRGLPKSPKKGAKRLTSENEVSPVKKTQTKSPRKSPKKAATKITPSIVIPKVPHEETEFQPTALTIDVPGDCGSLENANSLSASKDADLLRQGRRIRSPSIRYADDMILFPLKSPRRSRSPKGDSTGASPEDKVDDCDSRSSASSEKTMKTSSAQTSQLYSLLTGSLKESKSKAKEEDKQKESPVNKRSPRGRKKAESDTSGKESGGRIVSGRKGRGKGIKKEQQDSEKLNTAQKDDKKLKAVRELDFDSMGQKGQASDSSVKEKKTENSDNTNSQEKEKCVSSKDLVNFPTKSSGKKSNEAASFVKKSQGRTKGGRKKTKQAANKDEESEIGNIDKVLSLVKLELCDPEQNENYEKYTAISRKSQGLFDLISKVKNNIDYEKIFPGVIAGAPLYALDDDDIEGNEEMKDSDVEKDSQSKSIDHCAAEKECDTKETRDVLKEVTDKESESSSEKPVEIDENAQDEIVDDFFSEDFLQTKKSPKKKADSSPKKEDTLVKNVILPCSNEVDSETKISSDAKDVNSELKNLTSAVKNVASPVKSENSVPKTFYPTPTKSMQLTPQEESQIPISPADVILVDQATSSTTSGKTLFERFKEQKPLDEEMSVVDSTSGKDDSKVAVTDDKMCLLTIDVQERRNIFDTIMREYSPREKDRGEEMSTRSPKKSDGSETKNIKSFSPSKIGDSEKSESPEKKRDTERSQSPLKKSQGEKSQIHSEESTKSTEKSIVEKIQEKLGLDIEDSPKKTEESEGVETVEAQEEEKAKDKEEILENVSKKSETEERNFTTSLNVSKESSEFEICMDTVDDQQPHFFDGNDKLETSSLELNEGQLNSTVSEPDKIEAEPYVPTKHVPKASYGKIIKEPAPLSVLQTVEEKVDEKPNVFESEKLNEYLLDRCNRHVLIGKKKDLILNQSPTKSNVSSHVSPVTNESTSEVNEHTEISELREDGDEMEEIHDEDEDDDDDEMHAGSERGEGMPRLSSLVEECDPDFDEVDGVLFISFPNEESLNAHLKVEQKSKIGKSEKILLGMARMKNIRQRQKQIRQTAHKKKWARMKSLKAQFKIDQSLQGMHLVLAKYQRIYKRELVLNLLAKEEAQSQAGIPKQPQKTSDVTKIKGWKNKFGDNGGDPSKSLKQKGKLHWKTEESLLKSLHPDELREYGFDLKKKRRKNLIFTIRKGMSKGDGPGSKTEKVAESLDGGISSQESGVFIHDGLDTDEHYDGQVIADQEEYVVYDMERQKLLEKRVRDKEKKYLMKKLKMDNTDIDILRKLGGQRIGRSLKVPKSNEEIVDDSEMPKEAEGESKQEMEEDVIKEEPELAADGSVKKKRRKRRRNTFMIVTLNTALANFAVTALDRRFTPKKKKSPKKVTPNEGDVLSHDLSQNPPEVKVEPVDALDKDSDQISRPDSRQSISRPDSRQSISRPDSRQSNCGSSIMDQPGPDLPGSHDNQESKDKTCDKPGCRYGCICHLCQSWDTPSPEEPMSTGGATCNKEYCKLGCICDSTDLGPKEHCGKPECMFECQCLPKRKAALQGQKLISIEMEKSVRGRGGRGRRGRKKSRELHEPYPDMMMEVGVNDPEYYPGVSKTNMRKYASQNTRGRRGSGNQRYATLPKRETTYRLAKNLDAVSRKAMLVYEASEVYADHKGKTRKRQDSVDGQPAVSKPSPTVSTEMTTLSRPVLIAPKPQTMSGMVPPHIHQRQHMSKSKVAPSMDYDLSLFDSDSEGEDVMDVFSCARHLPYTHTARRKPRKCTCGVDHDQVCKTATVDSAAQSTLQEPDSNVHVPGAGKAGTIQVKNDHIQLPGWHTQWVCLKSNKEPAKSENDGIKLLEIMSNCNWEPQKQKLLSKISIMLQNGGYPKPKKRLVGEYWIEFLPKSEKPAVIPIQVKKNIPDTIYAVRIRIYKKLDSQYMNDLIKEQEKILESRVPPIIDASKTVAPVKTSGIVTSAGHSVLDSTVSVKQMDENSHQVPKMTVQGGISGLSQLQYSQQSNAKTLQTHSSQTTTTSLVYSTPKTSIHLNSSSSAAKSSGFVSLMSTTRVGALVCQTSINSVTKSTNVSTTATSSVLPVTVQQVKTSSKSLPSTSSVDVKSSNSVVFKTSYITQQSKASNIQSKELAKISVENLSSTAASSSVVASVLSSSVQSISTNQSLGTSKLVPINIGTPWRTLPRVTILGSQTLPPGSVQSLRPEISGKTAEYVGSFKGKLLAGTAVAQLVTPITVAGIDVTSTSLTSTTTTNSLPSKPTTNAAPASTEKPKSSTHCILDANKYSPLKIDPDSLKPLESMKVSKSSFSPLKTNSVKTSDTQITTAEKLCVIGSKTTPVTLLGPFDSPSKIPKVLPQMKVLQAKSISKDGKPVIHLIPYTTPMSGANVASNIMSVPITLSSISNVSETKGAKIPNAHEVKPDTLPTVSRPDQPDLTTGCMFTISNPVATTTSASTSVPTETSVGSSVTSPTESGHIIPSNGDQIILLSSGDASDKILEKLQNASVLDTEAFMTESEDSQRKEAFITENEDSQRKEACHDEEEEDGQSKKGNHDESLEKEIKLEKMDDVEEEKSAQKRKPSKEDEREKSKGVKKRKVSSDGDRASMLAKILVSKAAEQAYAQSRGVGTTAQMDRKEGNETDGLSASNWNDTKEGESPSCGSKTGRESENESEEEVMLHLDSSDDTDETVAGGLMESDLSNQSLEEKSNKDTKDQSQISGGNVEGHTEEAELTVKKEVTEEIDQEAGEGEKPESVGIKSEISDEDKQQSTLPCSLLALELTKGQSGPDVAECGDSNTDDANKGNSEVCKKRKQSDDDTEVDPSEAVPKTKRLKNGTEEQGEGSSDGRNSAESGVTDRETEDWENQMCMIEDTDDMTVVIPSDDDAEVTQRRTDQEIDCVILESSDEEEVDVEEDSGIDAVQLLRKQAEILKDCYKSSCNVHSFGKLDSSKAKRKSSHNTQVFMDDTPEFREGVIIASHSTSSGNKKVRSEDKSKAQQKRREEMRSAFLYLAEAMNGTNQPKDLIMKTLCSNEQKLSLMKKATFVIESLREYDRKFHDSYKELNAKNIMLKGKLNSLKDFMIKERGMPWMVLQAHLDKISKVCTKIIQNMPAILKTRAAGAPIRMIRPGMAVVGIKGQVMPRPGFRPQLQVRQAGPRLLSSAFPTFPHAKIGINQNAGVMRPNLSASNLSQGKLSADTKLSTKQKNDSVVSKKPQTQKVGSAKRKPSFTSPAVYIDYAEDEAEVYEDIIGSKSDLDDHFGDHVTDLSLEGGHSAPAVSKSGDSKTSNNADDCIRTQISKTTFSESQVDTYHIETSNCTLGSAIMNSSDSLSSNMTSRSSVVEVNMSDFGKVANLQNGHPSNDSLKLISRSASDSDKSLVNSDTNSLDLGKVKSESDS